MSIVLKDEHLEVLYILLNDEHDPKYFLPHFERECAELAEAGHIRLLSRIMQKLKPEIESSGIRAFLSNYGTVEIKKALLAHAKRGGLTQEHWNLLEKFVTNHPVSAKDIENEATAYDLVNMGLSINLFPSSGTVYYTSTAEGKAAYREHATPVTA